MGHTYSGFNVKNRARFTDAVEEARKAVNKAWADIRNVRRRKRASRLYRRWFGRYDRTRADQVFNVISAIHYAICGGSIRFQRLIGSSDYAVAYAPPGGWGNQTTRQLIDNGRYVVGVGDPLADANPGFLKALYNRSQAGKHGTVQTFIHEMSHLFGGTDDVQVRGVVCYGWLMSHMLAQLSPDKAVRHADCYGFYCAYQLDEETS